MHSVALPDDCPASGPIERLTRTFLTQLQEKLQTATTLDDLRAWADESIPSYQYFLHSMMRRQAQRAAPVVAQESSHSLCNALIKIIPFESGHGRPAEANPNCVQSLQSSPLFGQRGGLGEERGGHRRRKHSPPLPRQLLQSTSLLSSMSHDLDSVDVSSEVISALNMSFSWASWHVPSAPGAKGRAAHSMAECSRAIDPFSAQSPCHNGESIASLMGPTSLAATASPSRTAPPPIGAGDSAVAPVGMLSVLGDTETNQFVGMPAFSMDGHIPGQRLIFSRPSARHTPVLRPMKEVEALLESVSVPLIEDIDSPEADVLKYHEMFGDVDYVYVCLNVLLRYNFVKRYNINVERLHRYYNAALSFIRCRNIFHNTLRASDIVIAAHHFLIQPYLAENLSDEEIFAFLFASTVMNLGHLGAENNFLIDVRHPYATSHSYFSPLQSVSLSLAFSLLDNPSYAFIERPPRVESIANEACDNSNKKNADIVWTHESETQMRIEVARLLLFSDERNHQVLFGELTTILEEGDGSIVHDRHIPALLRNVLHAAEFCHLFRGLSVYRAGAAASVAEFYTQHAAFTRIKKDGMPLWSRKVLEKHVDANINVNDNNSENNVRSLPLLSDVMPKSSDVAAVRVLHSPNNGGHNVSSAEITEGEDNQRLEPSKVVSPNRRSASRVGVLTSLPHLYAKEMQMVLLERLFLPYMQALAKFVPVCWEVNMRKNLEWLRGYSADAFERDVQASFYRKYPVDAELKLCTDGFEQRVLKTIFNT